MNYITIDVNKKFLIISALLLTFVASLVGAYNIGRDAGIQLAVDYFNRAASKSNLKS
jgi:hypothetical protein